MLETLQEEKLREEIRQLRRPFWKQPAYITILVTVLLGSISYIRVENSRAKEALAKVQAENQKLERTLRDLERSRSAADIAAAERANSMLIRQRELMGQEFDLRQATLQQRAQNIEHQLHFASTALEAAQQQLECVQSAVARFEAVNAELTHHARENSDRTRDLVRDALVSPASDTLIVNLLSEPSRYRVNYLVGNVLGRAMRASDRDLNRLLESGLRGATAASPRCAALHMPRPFGAEPN